VRLKQLAMRLILFLLLWIIPFISSMGQSTVNGHRVLFMMFSPTGDQLAVVGTFGIHIYDMNQPEEAPRLIGGEYAPIRLVTFNSDWSWAAINAQDQLHLVDLTTGEHIRTMQSSTPVEVNELILSHGQHWIAATQGFESGKIYVWDVATGDLLYSENHRYLIGSPVFAINDAQLAYFTTDYDGVADTFIRIWHVITTTDWHNDFDNVPMFGDFSIIVDSAPEDSPFSADTEFVFYKERPSRFFAPTATDDIYVWDAITNELIMHIPVTWDVLQVPAGDHLLMQQSDSLILYNLTFNEAQMLIENDDYSQFTFTRDLSMMAVLDAQQDIIVFDVSSGEQLHYIERP